MNGRIVSPGTLARKVAPSTPPIAPGIASCQNSGQRTLPNQACEAPEAQVVAISAVCTVALATAGGSPSASRIALDTSP